jgi:hypothetical protein
MTGVVRVQVVNSCAASRPVLATLRAHSRLEPVAPDIYDAHVDGAAGPDRALAELAGALDREVTTDWDEVVSLSPRAG